MAQLLLCIVSWDDHDKTYLLCKQTTTDIVSAFPLDKRFKHSLVSTIFRLLAKYNAQDGIFSRLSQHIE